MIAATDGTTPPPTRPTDMATDMPLHSVVAVRIETTDGTSTCYNILHYYISSIGSVSGGTPASSVPAVTFLPQLCIETYENIAIPWAAASSEKVSLVSVMAQSIYPDPRSAPYFYAPGTPLPGNITGDCLPLQDAVTLVKRSIYGTRWGTGRYFHSGIPEANQELGKIDTDLYSLVNLYGLTLQDVQVVTVGDSSASFAPCIFNPIIKNGTLNATFIASIGLSDNVIKTQRRRRPGKGI